MKKILKYSLAAAALVGMSAGGTAVHFHRHRRRDGRVLSDRWRDLPPGQQDRKEHGIRCSVESTGGSVYNINTVRAGELEFGVAQSDWQYHAYNGTSRFADQGKFENLRAVFSVHPEPFTLIVRPVAASRSFEDLKGKRVNVGNPGSGQRATMEVVMDAFGITMDDFALATELKGSEMAQALCDGKIDAMIYTVGHPAAAITEAATTCDIEPGGRSGRPDRQAGRDNPFYRTATIPGGMYKGNAERHHHLRCGRNLRDVRRRAEDIVYTWSRACSTTSTTSRSCTRPSPT
jgi:TRAP transporter TAXI family solute receptor